MKKKLHIKQVTELELYSGFLRSIPKFILPHVIPQIPIVKANTESIERPMFLISLLNKQQHHRKTNKQTKKRKAEAGIWCLNNSSLGNSYSERFFSLPIRHTPGRVKQSSYEKSRRQRMSGLTSFGS